MVEGESGVFLGDILNYSRWLIAALAIGLSACTVTVDEGNPPPRPGPGPDRPGICSRDYNPVCAQRGGERKTFVNGCIADSRGFDVIYRGECRVGPPLTPRPPRPGDPRPLPDDTGVVCPTIYAPVCARQGGVVRTFANSCVAGASGFRVIGDGEC
jgi:Kazal-type serine protease inhibitor domain